MRAVTYSDYGPIENLSVGDVPAPLPRRGELVVEVRRAALNPKDAFFRKGKFSLLSGRRFPKLAGLDYAGVVRESRSPRFAAGERVFGMLEELTARRGTLAELVRVREREAARVPDGVSDDDAAAVPLAGLTALQALRDDAAVRPGARVWIHGASGGVGTLAIQIARILGAEVTTTSSAANRAFCEELGAHETLDYRAPYLPQLRGRVDVVFDVFGNLRMSQIADVFAERGVLVSTIPSPARVVLDALTRRRRIQRRLVLVRARGGDLAELGRWLAQGKLRAVIDSRHPLERVHEAFRLLESKRARGKIVIQVA